MVHSNIADAITAIPGIMLAFSVFGYSQAKLAIRLGDNTPKFMGRDNFSPLAHTDIFGLACMLLFGFGWGKSVLVNRYNFLNPKRDGVLVALVGPLSNILVGFLCTAFFLMFGNNSIEGVREILYWGIMSNVSLALFSLLPIPGFVGFQIIEPFLPDAIITKIQENNFIVFILALIIINTPILSGVIRPLREIIFNLYLIILQFLG